MLPPWTKSMGELRDREDALSCVASDLLLAHPSKEADVVLPHCLLVTPLAKLTDLAMVVQDQILAIACCLTYCLVEISSAS
jgi:hypothetical protein